MTDEVRHRFKRDRYMWTCVWCGLKIKGGAVLKTGEPRVIDVGSGSPCTLGVEVTDSIEAKDKLS